MGRQRQHERWLHRLESLKTDGELGGKTLRKLELAMRWRRNMKGPSKRGRCSKTFVKRSLKGSY